MFNDRDRTYSGWVCVDCLMLHANGETPTEMSEAEVAEYLARVAHYTEGCELTLGKFREDHDCATNWRVTWHAPHRVRGSYRRGYVEVRADNGRDAADEALWDRSVPADAWVVMVRSHELETESDRGGECDCEQQSFSWSACDMCGSNLGGSRDAMVFWFGPAETEPAPEPGPGLHTDPQYACAACAADPSISPSDHDGILAMAAQIHADWAGFIAEHSDRSENQS